MKYKIKLCCFSKARRKSLHAKFIHRNRITIAMGNPSCAAAGLFCCSCWCAGPALVSCYICYVANITVQSETRQGSCFMFPLRSELFLKHHQQYQLSVRAGPSFGIKKLQKLYPSSSQYLIKDNR